MESETRHRLVVVYAASCFALADSDFNLVASIRIHNFNILVAKEIDKERNRTRNDAS
jgi:hypothetical protein